MTPEQKDRLEKLFRLVGSDQPNEALAALAQVQKVLAAEKLSWNEFVDKLNFPKFGDGETQKIDERFKERKEYWDYMTQAAQAMVIQAQAYNQAATQEAMNRAMNNARSQWGTRERTATQSDTKWFKGANFGEKK